MTHAIDVLSRAHLRQLRRTEYDRLVAEGCFDGERIELIHGMVVETSPAGPSHADLTSLLTKRFVVPLVDRAEVRIQLPFIAGDESEPEPDLALVPPGRYRDRHPDRAFLIVEVSESSLAHDRDTKGPLYASAGVPEYWIVNIGERCIEVRDQPEAGVYARTRSYSTGESIAPEAFPDVRIRVDELFGA